MEPSTQVAGGVVIFDMDGLTLQQTWQFTPPFAKRIVDLLQEAVPLRVKNLHIVNQPYVFNMVFALFKPFLGEKLKSRVSFFFYVIIDKYIHGIRVICLCIFLSSFLPR